MADDLPATEMRLITPAAAGGESPRESPSWMRRWLIAAGIYNLAWGGLTVLVPGWLFDLTGMERPLYPFIWQCVGMIVGVYGIGYLAASTDPVRHWPIVLVGLLGKIFGPLGYVSGVLRGEVPPAFGVTLPSNDLLWWIPFALILRQAWLAGQARDPAGGSAVAGGGPSVMPWAARDAEDERARGEPLRRAASDR